MAENTDGDQASLPRGLICPRCGCRQFYTTHTEPMRNGVIRRRKTCRHCGRRIVTYERPIGFKADGGCYT